MKLLALALAALLAGLCIAAEDRFTVVAEGKAVQPYEVKGIQVAMCRKAGDNRFWYVAKVQFVHNRETTYHIRVSINTYIGEPITGTQVVRAVPPGRLAQAQIAVPMLASEVSMLPAAFARIPQKVEVSFTPLAVVDHSASK